MSSLWGNSGTSANRPSLFGNPSTSAPTGSLFSSQPAQATSSFPNNSSQPTQPQAAQPSLFGSIGTGAQAQQKPGPSLFGSATNSSQPPQQQQTTTGTLFGLSNSTTTQAQQQANGSLSQPSATGQQVQPSPSGAYFDSLLEKSRKRAFGGTALEELPSLQLGLGDLRDRLRKLGPATQDRGPDGKAHYLLAASGVEPGSAVRDLNFFDSHAVKTERDQQSHPSDTDVESYISNLQTQTTLSMIEEGLARSVRDFDTFLEENVTMEWDTQRKRIYEHFGIRSRSREGVGQESSVGYSNLDSRGGFGRSRRRKGQPSHGQKTQRPSNEHSAGRASLQNSVIGPAGLIGSNLRPPFVNTDTGISGSAGFGPEDQLTREKESRFIEKVQALNAARLSNATYPILHEFANAVSLSNDVHLLEVVSAYKAMIEIVGEDPGIESPSEPGAVRERQFAHGYLEATPQSQAGLELRRKILKGSTRHLEKQFFQNMEILVSKNPREANMGGVPNVLSKVKGYIRLRALRKDLVPDNTDLQMLGDDFVWAVVFYLLRTGHTREAAEYVTGNAVAFRTIDRNFITYITDYSNNPDRRLRRDLQERINNEYNQRVHIAPENSIDPFRMACYKVVGRCDLTNRSFTGLHQNLEDWTWLQFTLAREVNIIDEPANDVFTLEGVQDSITSLGAKFFTKASPEQNSGFGMFFYLQILCGLFEKAIQFLYSFQYVDAVHFAIALDYYGLLRVSDLHTPGTDLLSLDIRERPQINFAQMVGWYTRDFRAANVVAAVDYLALICLNRDLPGDAGQQQVSICHQGMRELILDSREFAKLLGDLDMEGQRMRGAIEVRMQLLGLSDPDNFMRTVTIEAASIADDNGRTADAVLLYHLSEEYDKVLSIVNRALGEAIAVEIGQEKLPLLPLRPRTESTIQNQNKVSSLSLTTVDDAPSLGRVVRKLYFGKPMFMQGVSQKNRDALDILLAVSDAKDRIREGKWAEAIDLIRGTDVLPLEAGGNSSVVRQFASKYPALHESIIRIVPNLILWTIQSCSKQRAILTHAEFASNEGTRRQMIEDLKTKSRDLMMYVGFMKYKLPASVNDTLVRIAAE